uniref:Tc1-like transposase DDE domain-containing protein n=1 Tax=Caenorhabditis japonica TaxID=281687 RepID=A0A8R1I9K7_CAEJA
MIFKGYFSNLTFDICFHGLHGRRPVKKPLISKKNRKARVAWAKAHVNWGRREWANHVWNNESKFNLFGTDGIKWVRRPVGSRFDPKYQCPTVKHGGGSCMVWGCFSDTSMRPLRRVQDNDPKHASGHIKNWFQRRRVDLLDWPSQSPDLNLIEHLWEELERRIQGVRASNVNQKFDLLEAAWKDIPMSVIHKLLDSMPRRCQAVIDAKGYATRY